MRVHTVLACFDGSPEADEQLQSAIGVALWFDAFLSVASISYVPEFRRSAEYTPDRAVLRMKAAKAALDRTRLVIARLEAHDVSGVAFPLVASRTDFKRQFEGLSRCADVIFQPGTPQLTEYETLPFVAHKRIA